MSFSVDWTPVALDALAAIWVSSPHRQAVTAAQARIDRLLAANPLGNGAPRGEGLYVIDVHPLRALFEVSAADRVVKVVSAHELA
jgi:hypothetical protein